jgi:predicted lipid-binding transport protein (Tim44 family)
MKTWLIALTIAGMAASLVPIDAEARRLGGGQSSGMQRDMPAQRNAAPQTPATPAATPAAAGAAGAASRPGWMAPVAGLAAGLGLVALASYFGFGEALANFLLIALLALAAFVVIGLLLRRHAAQRAPHLAGAGAGSGGLFRMPNQSPAPAWGGSGGGSPAARPLPGAAADPVMAPVMPGQGPVGSVPADFDRAGFERIAKMIFIRMQAAYDAADLADLRQFTTPELFASIRLDLQERGSAANHTDVVQVDAEVLDVTDEATRQIVSVRFHGLIREEEGADAQTFDEVWHLVKAADSNWAIAGIQQNPK